MLKVLCGLQAGEPIPGTLSLERWTVPLSWLEILFGSAPFPPRTGLYSPKEVTRHPGAEAGIVTERTFETRRPVAPEGRPATRRHGEKQGFSEHAARMAAERKARRGRGGKRRP